MKEIITLQFGSYANYTGAHFWNLQDELLGLVEREPENSLWQDIDSDILYRTGETREGVKTYTPRVLIYDLRGSLGAVRATGSLYSPQPDSTDIQTITTWEGRKAVHKADVVEKNAFLQSLDAEMDDVAEEHERGSCPGEGVGGENDDVAGPQGDEAALVDDLEEGVEYWTDYLKAQLHALSVNEVEGVWHGVAQDETYGDGLDWLRSEEDREGVQDCVRRFAEECDHLQGFQTLVDVSGGFSALASSTLEGIADEYPSVPRMTLALKPPQNKTSGDETPPSSSEHTRTARMLSDAASFGALARNSTVFVPAWRPSIGSGSFPSLFVNDSKPFQTSAIFATTFETLSTPYRLRAASPTRPAGSHAGATDLRSFANLLCQSPSANVSALFLALPAPGISAMGSVANPLDASRIVHALVPLSPSVAASWEGTPLAEALSLRGSCYAGSTERASVANASAALSAALLSERRGLCMRHLAVSQQPLAIPLPFPRIFQTGNSGGTWSLESAPALTRLSVSAALLPFLKKMSSSLNGKRVGRTSALLDSWGINSGELREYVHAVEETYQGKRLQEDSD